MPAKCHLARPGEPGCVRLLLGAILGESLANDGLPQAPTLAVGVSCVRRPVLPLGDPGRVELSQ